jgi:predicted heme/steroid binding protein
MIISRKTRIVHLDDHSLFQKGLRSCLLSAGQEFMIEQYQYSQHAFEVIKQLARVGEPLDLIITDFVP